MNGEMLVGYTGFVGSNIDAMHKFEYRINTRNSEEALGKEPELLVYAGLRAEKFLANSNPEADMDTVTEAYNRILNINPKRLVLISTVDVYKEPVNVDENTVIDTDGLAAYGLNRYKLEMMIRERYPNALIVRLPGLFGRNIKKNFIYDYINVIPSMLKEDKYKELSAGSSLIKTSYELQSNGFYKCVVKDELKEELKEEFKRAGFSALYFTDSRGRFQFYNLARLWSDIETALKHDIRLLNIATEPVAVSEVYEALTDGERFVNEISSTIPNYDYKSVHAELFGGRNGYFYDKARVLKEIREFVFSQC